ncbi:MAG: HAMP domain-containing sensor histidine kinase [bacterium]|nr:HAMP domain-containing sensor histidine kinase [bacterium]
MKLKKNSLITKIWISLIIFSIIILSFLWLFQIVFLNSFYEFSKTLEMDKIVRDIKNNYNNQNIDEILDLISYNKGVCIEVVENSNIIYNASNFNKGCLSNPLLNEKKKDFILSGKDSYSEKVINSKFDNKILIKGLKINNSYIFINMPLEILNSTTTILSSQLIIVTFIIFILSFIISYFISRKISSPIININNTAKSLSQGNYNIVFERDSDIKEITQLVDTLNYTKDELSKTDELRRELIANITHDLKTPLTMIKAYAELVKDIDTDKEKRDNNLQVIIEETDRLNNLVNDILDLSKIQSNISKLEYSNFDINKVVKTIMNRFSYLKETKNYIFKCNTISAYVNADKKKIEQVIYNLMGNAINHIGDDKTVIVNIKDKEDSYLVEIINNGKPIKEQDINLIWDKYYKTNKKYKRDYISTGIGLSIVKGILIEHKFNYGVKSSIKDGTIFYFYIPKNK